MAQISTTTVHVANVGTEGGSNATMNENRTAAKYTNLVQRELVWMTKHHCIHEGLKYIFPAPLASLGARNGD